MAEEEPSMTAETLSDRASAHVTTGAIADGVVIGHCGAATARG
jgi:hypothetical protein